MEYEYKTIEPDMLNSQLFCDCLEDFGWHPFTPVDGIAYPLRLRRNRNLGESARLNDLQRSFEEVFGAIERLEVSRPRTAQICALSLGVLGFALLTGAVFSYGAGRDALTVFLALPGAAGCIAPWFLYRRLLKKASEGIGPKLKEQKDELYRLCREARDLTG